MFLIVFVKPKKGWVAFDMYGFGEANFLNKKAILTFLFIFGLFIDFILLVLTFNRYYFMLLKTSDYMPVILLNFILYLLLIIISKQKFWKIFWGAVVPLLAFPIIMGSIIFPPNFSYYDLHAPENNESLNIEIGAWGRRIIFITFTERHPFPV